MPETAVIWSRQVTSGAVAWSPHALRCPASSSTPSACHPYSLLHTGTREASQANASTRYRIPLSVCTMQKILRAHENIPTVLRCLRAPGSNQKMMRSHHLSQQKLSRGCRTHATAVAIQCNETYAPFPCQDGFFIAEVRADASDRSHLMMCNRQT